MASPLDISSQYVITFFKDKKPDIIDKNLNAIIADITFIMGIKKIYIIEKMLTIPTCAFICPIEVSITSDESASALPKNGTKFPIASFADFKESSSVFFVKLTSTVNTAVKMPIIVGNDTFMMLFIVFFIDKKMSFSINAETVAKIKYNNDNGTKKAFNI
jgi:hypothetical protein